MGIHLLTREAQAVAIDKVHSLKSLNQHFKLVAIHQGIKKADLAHTAVLNQVEQTEQVTMVAQQLKSTKNYTRKTSCLI